MDTAIEGEGGWDGKRHLQITCEAFPFAGKEWGLELFLVPSMYFLFFHQEFFSLFLFPSLPPWLLMWLVSSRNPPPRLVTIFFSLLFTCFTAQCTHCRVQGLKPRSLCHLSSWWHELLSGCVAPPSLRIFIELDSFHGKVLVSQIYDIFRISLLFKKLPGL